ncbi:MAG: polyprenyl diphosphate synthase [Anaerobiospirillum succiniciproducens]|uniref:polyprenyl diphosphate synthase n=1 Tax=Anaerobiospirillum succiniciproducens TaxID=13335 RepID=UPI00235463F4|nr:polyprenyl diphosphate synthase [Anaerobiospirillum succiniciproducens]MDY2797774.1 polyprenyl diphosphate synthase [Anaerobiospirillum succiniciproducens]
MHSSNNHGEAKVPRHLAIIMDGNGRWAKKRGMIRLMGHRRGAQAVTRAVETAVAKGVQTLTLFAFSSENWRRPQDEVSGLMDLFAKVLKSERDRLHDNGIKVQFIGDLSKFSSRLNEAIDELVSLTCNNQRMVLNIAINYGGRWELMQAAKSLAIDLKNGKISEQDITEEAMQERLCVAQDVDLLIRTGGECRISNFLLFQCAYSEFYVTDTLWPDFDEKEFDKALNYFNGRERRFGMTSEQVAAKA